MWEKRKALYSSCHPREQKLATGITGSNKLKGLIIDFKPTDNL